MSCSPRGRRPDHTGGSAMSSWPKSEGSSANTTSQAEPDSPTGNGGQRLRVMTKRLAPLFSSASVHWATPSVLLTDLRKEFGVLHDPCPLLGHDMSLWDSPGGLTRPWQSPTYVNPPYGPAITKWLQKAVEEARRGITVIALVPSRTDTEWWHRYVMTATEIRFLRGRLRFGHARNSAPFPSALIIWR